MPPSPPHAAQHVPCLMPPSMHHATQPPSPPHVAQHAPCHLVCLMPPSYCSARKEATRSKGAVPQCAPALPLWCPPAPWVAARPGGLLPVLRDASFRKPSVYTHGTHESPSGLPFHHAQGASCHHAQGACHSLLLSLLPPSHPALKDARGAPRIPAAKHAACTPQMVAVPSYMLDSHHLRRAPS